MSIEAMKQALEVLEDFVDDPRAQKQIDEASISLRQAIAEVEKQEPVAEVTSETGAEITMSWWHEPALPIGTKLYTTPQQRTWVGLTDEEFNKICSENHPLDGLRTFVQAIETKLKQKNT